MSAVQRFIGAMMVVALLAFIAALVAPAFQTPAQREDADLTYRLRQACADAQAGKVGADLAMTQSVCKRAQETPR